MKSNYSRELQNIKEGFKSTHTKLVLILTCAIDISHTRQVKLLITNSRKRIINQKRKRDAKHFPKNCPARQNMQHMK